MIITTAIIKGGAGKSSLAAALAQWAVLAGKKVLAIDLDQQGNLSTFLNGQAAEQHNSYTLIEKKDKATACLQHTAQGIDLIPAYYDLALLKTSKGSAKRLANAIKDLKATYDLIVIDTPPAIGEAVYNALQASDGLIIPLEADASSAQGLRQAAGLALQMKAGNPDLKVLGALITRYSGRSKVNQYLQEQIQEEAAALGVPYLGEIRQGIAVREAQYMQENLFEYAGKSNPAADYRRIFEGLGV